MKDPIVFPGPLSVAIRLMATVSLLVACHTNSSGFVWVQDLPPVVRRAVAEPLRPGDHVFVVVRGQEALTGDFEVRPGGEVVLPAIGPVPAAGVTSDQLAALVRDRMKGLLTDPQVSAVLSQRKALISIIGEVKSSGQYDLSAGEHVLQALARAGGLGLFADENGIYVVRQRPVPQRVRFRYSDLVNGDAQSNRFELVDGDVIVVE
jgi:polysaccharide export outer membrane protein